MIAVEAELVGTKNKIETVRFRKLFYCIHSEEESGTVRVGREASEVGRGRGVGPHEICDWAFNGDFFEAFQNTVHDLR